MERGARVRCDVLAVGTELLLGQIVDTNSAWIGEQLAQAGIDSYEHVVVGDNPARIVETLRALLAKSEAVIVCGGLGPTQDDVTRECIAEVMNVGLERREDIVEHIASMFSARGRDMAENNKRQADVPVGADVIWNERGTAPGLICPVGHKVVYAVPGVPYEMQNMVGGAVLPDLLRRSGAQSTIVSRTLKTWGVAESTLAELIADRVDTQTNPTIAFLARGIEGICVRITAKGSNEAEAGALIDAEEKVVREILGDIVFAVDDATMESTVLDLLRERGWTLGTAESLTGGMIASRLASVGGASDGFVGSIVSYETRIKRDVLGVTAEHIISDECAIQMAEGARRVLGCDVAVAVTGVAGPEPMEGQPVGTVHMAVAVGEARPEAVKVRLPGGRDQVRQFTTISALDLVRRRLLGLAHGIGLR
jgi:nicotinamide-nucleotide amidase